MDSKRIKEIQLETAYPESVSVYQALLQVWRECEHEHKKELEAKLKEPIEKICLVQGHNMYEVVKHDNGRSYLTMHRCSRCGYEEENQYDHTVNF